MTTDELLTASRELQRRQAPFTIERAIVRVKVAWDGTIEQEMHYLGVLPVGTAPLWELTFAQLSIVDSRHTATLAEGRVVVAPGLETESVSDVLENVRYHRWRIPGGWTGPAIDVHLKVTITGALDTTGRRKHELRVGLPVREIDGHVSYHLPYVVGSLEYSLTFPKPYVPLSWGPVWAWSGFAGLQFAPANLIDAGVCRSWSAETAGGHFRLMIDAPLAERSYGILWSPGDHVRYLEARRAATGG